jgi:hypothetical protein
MLGGNRNSHCFCLWNITLWRILRLGQARVLANDHGGRRGPEFAGWSLELLVSTCGILLFGGSCDGLSSLITC